MFPHEEKTAHLAHGGPLSWESLILPSREGRDFAVGEHLISFQARLFSRKRWESATISCVAGLPQIPYPTHWAGVFCNGHDAFARPLQRGSPGSRASLELPRRDGVN